jgi:Protein of unknown function (DUF2786)
MGKNNRQRRAEKRRDRARSQGPRPGQDRRTESEPTTRLSDRDLLEILTFEAAKAAERSDENALEVALAKITAIGVASAATGPGRSMLGLVMPGCLIRALRGAWDGGWQPADIDRATAKRLGRAHVHAVRRAIASEARTSAGPATEVPESWAAQLRQVAATSEVPPEWSDPGAARVGVELLGMLIHLPVMPRLMPPPSEWGRRHGHAAPTPPIDTVDGRWLAKVRALLAKAESTDFEEEADSLTAKAQELMARHAIDQAMVAGVNAGEAPCGRRIGIDDPYAVGKVELLATVAVANRCRTVWMDGYGFSTVFGFAGDIDIVEILYTSLLVQATRAMTAAGSVRDSSGRSRTRSFRQSFLLSFARRIGERLREATIVATEEAEVVHGGGLLPVLARRSVVVEDAFEALFPKLRPVGGRASNWEGWVAGRIAADNANLGADQQLTSGAA